MIPARRLTWLILTIALLAAIAAALPFVLTDFMYLAVATYNELFLLWVALVLLSSQALVRLLLSVPASTFTLSDGRLWGRRYVGAFLLVNGALIAFL